MYNLLIEAIVVGSLLLLVSYPIMRIVKLYFPKPKYGDNKFYISTIIIGMMVHFIAEFSGINKWYCKNGYACRNK